MAVWYAAVFKISSRNGTGGVPISGKTVGSYPLDRALHIQYKRRQQINDRYIASRIKLHQRSN